MDKMGEINFFIFKGPKNFLKIFLKIQKSWGKFSKTPEASPAFSSKLVQMFPAAFPHLKRLGKFLVYRSGFWSISQYQDFGETIGNVLSNNEMCEFYFDL